jgi:hypothetical protein
MGAGIERKNEREHRDKHEDLLHREALLLVVVDR